MRALIERKLYEATYKNYREMHELIKLRLLTESAITKKWVDGVKKWWKQWVKEANSVSKLRGSKSYKKVVSYIKEGESRLQRLKDDLDYKKGALAFPEFMTNARRENIKQYKGLDPRVDLAYMFSDAFEKLYDVKSGLETWYKFVYKPDSRERQLYGYDPAYKYGKGRNLNAYDASVESLLSSIKDVDSIVSGKLFRRLNKFLSDSEKLNSNISLAREGESEVAIGRVKMIFDTGRRDPHGLSRMGAYTVHPSMTDRYVGEVKKAKALLDKAGLGKAWYGEFFIQPSAKASEHTSRRTGGKFKAGAHWSWKDHVVLFGNPGATLHKTIIHELGHRWYYKIMTQAERARFDEYFSGVDIGPTEPSKVRAVSSYGTENAAEDFAEVFAWYVSGGKLTPDQRERFKAFALKGGKIKRHESKEFGTLIDRLTEFLDA